MPRVYVIQEPASRVDGQWVPKYDLSAAEAFGELTRVLGFGNVPSDPEPTVRALWLAFARYDFASDFVLLLGDPVASAMAVSVLTQKKVIADEAEGGDHPIVALKWDRRAGTYAPYVVG